MKRHLLNEKGLSILEIIASLLIISIIILAVIPLFFTSAKTVEKSGDIIDATYRAQNGMEEVRHELVNTEPILNETFEQYIEERVPDSWGDSRLIEEEYIYEKNEDDYISILYIKETEEDGNLLTLRLEVFPQSNPAIIDSQMETIIQWKD